ncbi:MAG: aminodeoxychorismate/anthranilate synthase component II [Aureispira sp.]|nr:aminodeoxychorismate/anthranilate synthase component II [Aureispira sp.]
MQILLLDNYDSFTYNLYDYLSQCGASCRVVRNDQMTLNELAVCHFDGIVLSPGPKRPKDAGILMQVIEKYHQQLPILGVCLGHQAIGEFFGAKLVHATVPRHGKTSMITHQQTGIFAQLPNPMQVMRYHSLVLEELPNYLVGVAHSQEQELMAIQHQKYPLTGIQFHPESILTPNGLALLNNWLKLASKFHLVD